MQVISAVSTTTGSAKPFVCILRREVTVLPWPGCASNKRPIYPEHCPIRLRLHGGSMPEPTSCRSRPLRPLSNCKPSRVHLVAEKEWGRELFSASSTSQGNGQRLMIEGNRFFGGSPSHNNSELLRGSNLSFSRLQHQLPCCICPGHLNGGEVASLISEADPIIFVKRKAPIRTRIDRQSDRLRLGFSCILLQRARGDNP